MASKWVIELSEEEATERGRRPILLSVNASRGFVATVELLGSSYICTLYDICLNKVVGTREHGAGYTSLQIGNTIRDLLRAKRIAQHQLMGIHLIFPGQIDDDTKSIRSALSIPSDEMVDSTLVHELEKRFVNSKVMLSTNGTIIAFSEFIADRDQTALPLLSMNIDESIIGGVVMDNDRSGLRLCFPLEVGHVIVDRNGPACKCGNRGCLESLCATPLLFRAMNERASMALDYSESFGAECNPAAMEKIAGRINGGDAQATAVLQEYVTTLCCGVMSVVNMLNVKSVHIGGDITILGDRFLEMVCSTLREQFQPLGGSTDDLHVELFISDYEHVRRAATILCLDELFHQ